MQGAILEFKRAPREARTVMDTWVLTLDTINTWRLPSFQRPLRVNEKVRSIATEMKATEIVPGVITLGLVDTGRDRTTYLMDGQHRVEAFRLSELKEAFADIRICHFDSLAAMGAMFVELNSSIVKMRPDDILRGMEGGISAIAEIKKACPFIGYDNVRRGPNSPILSMSVVIKAWRFAANETPINGGISGGALGVAQEMTYEDTEQLITFINMVHAAWGRDHEYARLWSALNLTLCMWLYRRIVLDVDRLTKRASVLTIAQFKNCMMALSADTAYLSWLVGRSLSEADRSPCYTRIKNAMAKRLTADRWDGGKPKFPQPAWVTK